MATPTRERTATAGDGGVARSGGGGGYSFRGGCAFAPPDDVPSDAASTNVAENDRGLGMIVDLRSPAGEIGTGSLRAGDFNGIMYWLTVGKT